jgi:hypothetical protein
MPDWFAQTSDAPYNRHQYRFVYSNNQSKIFDSWEEAMEAWFNTPAQFSSHIDVLDKNKKSQGGFK